MQCVQDNNDFFNVVELIHHDTVCKSLNSFSAVGPNTSLMIYWLISKVLWAQFIKKTDVSQSSICEIGLLIDRQDSQTETPFT